MGLDPEADQRRQAASAAGDAARFGMTHEQFLQGMGEPLTAETAGKAFVSLATGQV